MEHHPQSSPNLLFTSLYKLTTINNQLKEAAISQSIQPPRIIVIGTQSAGKSSVLESIIGLDFLPKGAGVITRRPIEINLVHLSPYEREEPKPYAEFPKEGDKKYYNFQQVQDKISELINDKAGKRKDVLDDPIAITIYSPDCPNMTLVDLPGIIRLRPEYDLANIERKTKDMSRRYAKDPRTIILCVTPANQELATSDALQMAFEEDPEGFRTLGVITKIDIMDKGTNAKKMLLNSEVSLKLGYVGLKGRSQQDLQYDMKVVEGLKIENYFFASHPVYSTLPSGLVGTEALLKKLSEILFIHIRRTIPEICKEIQAKATECEEKLKDLDLCKDEDDQIIAEKESLNKTLEVLENVESTLNNDPDLTLSPQDDVFFRKLEKREECQKDGLEETKVKGRDLFSKEPLEQKNDNPFGPKAKGANLFGSQEQQNKNHFAPKRGLFG